MTSRLFSIFRMFPRASTAVGPRPNSWAELALWRRFFQMKDEEEEEITEMIVDLVGSECIVADNGIGEGYISSSEAIEARSSLIRDGYRNLLIDDSNPNRSKSAMSGSRRSNRQSRRELDDNDLNIPVGDGSYVTRAQ